MFVDSRKIDQDAEIETDICIVGAGAAGITIAMELAGTPFRVALVEGGGLDYEDETQDMMRGEVRRGIEDQLITSRMRYFGGTTNVWGGECVPLSAIDFERREAVPLSGWPITLTDLDPHYVRAQKILKVGEYDYDPASVARRFNLALLPFDPSRVVTSVSRHRSTNFGVEYHDVLEKSENVRVFLYGNLTNINRDPDKPIVRDLSIKTLSSKEFRIKSRIYILAMGGIENARMLLVSRDVDAAGIGNGNDHVGRYFMEHLSFVSGFLIPADAGKSYALYREMQSDSDEYEISAKLALSDELVRKLEIPNYRCVITASPNPSYVDATEAARDVYHDLRGGQWPDALLDRIGEMLAGMADYTGDRLSGAGDVFYALRSFGEQVPNPDSRVGLTNERDALGLNRLYLDWRLSRADRVGISEGMKALAMEAGRSGFGRVRINFATPEEVLPEGAHGAHHHIGTTRMAANAKLGVVDADCRVHGVGNLYVAGSSVFPTSGHANPTLTIVAMSVRLADHIKSKMRS